jgi:nucleoside 2-deoxyribosyltransferase
MAEPLPPRVYLAGPDVFCPDAVERGESLKRLCQAYRFEGVYPLDGEASFSGPIRAMGKKIAQANREKIHTCQYVLANLTPFRGPSADPGTVWECGYASGLGLKVFGYRPEPEKTYREHVVGNIPHDGMVIENFGVCDNIMIVHGVECIQSTPRRALTALHKAHYGVSPSEP